MRLVAYKKQASKIERRGSLLLPMDSMTLFSEGEAEARHTQMDQLTVRIKRTERDFKVEHPRVVA